jgi:hypothetical protein
MLNWLRGIQKHLLIWVVLLVYFFSANQLFVTFFLKNGKPFAQHISIPPVTQGIKFQLSDLLQPVRVDGQALFELKGYVYDPANPVKDVTITVVLSSADQNFEFSTRSVPIPNLIESVPSYTQGMAKDEFSLLISNQALQPGLYTIGILSKNNSGTGQSYVLTGGKIRKTPNTLKYLPG